jgi:hypothetical protein
MIEVIDYQYKIFRVKKVNIQLVKVSLYRGNEIKALPAKVKGSTLGWNVAGTFVSYNQIRKLLNHNKNK